MKYISYILLTIACAQAMSCGTAQGNPRKKSDFDKVLAAAKKRDANRLAALIKQRVDINVQDKDGNTPLHIVMQKDSSFSQAEFLINAGALSRKNFKGFGFTPFENAIQILHHNSSGNYISFLSSASRETERKINQLNRLAEENAKKAAAQEKSESKKEDDAKKDS